MNWRSYRRIFSLIAALLTLNGCGVRGDPLPPEKPPELGRGRPTYRRATEGIPIERQAPVVEEEKDEEEDERN